jgi:hypothetical protein
VSDFGLVESFHCDDDSLDGLTPAQIFVLGYQFCQVCELMDKHKEHWCGFIRVENMRRISLAAKHRGLSCVFHMYPGDKSESYVRAVWCQVDKAE